jgi:prepilin-type N-terminal cleavage/methylation domain-containing protein
MHHKAENLKKGFTLVEAMVVMAILTLLMGFAWRFYFGGRETMRHTVSQSQVQADTRIFLDQLEEEMASCYRFSEVNNEEKKFSFYSFAYGRTPLDEVLYDATGKPRTTGSDSDAQIKAVKYEYSWADNKVTKKRTPGWLLFLREPMEFREGDETHFINRYKKMEKTVLRNIENFEIKGYSQITDPKTLTVTTTPTTADDYDETAFIVLRLHTRKAEAKNQRDEELDIVTKFYSQTKLAEIANPDYFCTTDQQGRF